MKLSAFLGFWLAVILVLVGMTAIDWIVHAMLYRYGLHFSYDWANPYWFFLNMEFLSTGLLAACAYWLFRRPDVRHVVTALLVGWSVIVQVVAYNLDILWNIINACMGYRPFPDLDYVWGWGWVDWITKIFLHRPATTLDVLIGSAFLNGLTLLAWVVRECYFRRTFRTKSRK